jgi:putative membrane protein
MMYYGHGMGAWGYLLMTAYVLLYGGLVTAGIVVLVGYLGRSGPAGGAHSSAETILADRFARGEIDAEEYRRRLGALRG